MSPATKAVKRLKPTKTTKENPQQHNTQEQTKQQTPKENKQQQMEQEIQQPEKTEIQILNETLQHRENASVAAIEKLTTILIENIKTQQQATTAAAAAAAAADEEKKKNQNFKDYFQPTVHTKNNDNNHIIEEIKTTDNNLQRITKDYTEQLRQIHNTNIKDPNIPQVDAIQVRQKSIEEINTINIITKTINTMKQQIKQLSDDNNTLKEANNSIKNEVRQLKILMDNKSQNPSSRNSNEQQTTEQTTHENDEFQIQRTRNNRNRTKIEVTQLSPGPGESDNSGTTPPVAYAKVVSRYIQKPPKTKLSEEMIEKIQNQGSEIPNNTTQEEEPHREKIPKEKMEKIKQQIRNSSQVVGLKPITNFNIHQETEKIINSGQYDKTTEREKIKNAAVKNAIFRFLKEELKMDEKTRNSIKIQKIFPSQNEMSTTYYIQCEDQDEIAKITSRAVNINSETSQREEPGIVPHIPKILYTRYQALEKLAYHIRMTDKGKIQTNIRLAKTDYLMRVKYKEDKTPWKHVNPIEIPEYIPKPEMQLLKEDNNTKQQTTVPNTNTTTDPSQTPPRQNLWDHFNLQTTEQTDREQMNTQGTMSEFLQAHKHNISPIVQTTDNKKKKIIPDDTEEKDEQMNIEENEDNQEKDNTPQRTASINKIINNLPNGVTMKTTNQGQNNEHHG